MLNYFMWRLILLNKRAELWIGFSARSKRNASLIRRVPKNCMKYYMCPLLRLKNLGENEGEGHQSYVVKEHLGISFVPLRLCLLIGLPAPGTGAQWCNTAVLFWISIFGNVQWVKGAHGNWCISAKATGSDELLPALVCGKRWWPRVCADRGEWHLFPCPLCFFNRKLRVILITPRERESHVFPPFERLTWLLSSTVHKSATAESVVRGAGAHMHIRAPELAANAAEAAQAVADRWSTGERDGLRWRKKESASDRYLLVLLRIAAVFLQVYCIPNSLINGPTEPHVTCASQDETGHLQAGSGGGCCGKWYTEGSKLLSTGWAYSLAGIRFSSSLSPQS